MCGQECEFQWILSSALDLPPFSFLCCLDRSSVSLCQHYKLIVVLSNPPPPQMAAFSLTWESLKTHALLK